MRQEGAVYFMRILCLFLACIILGLTIGLVVFAKENLAFCLLIVVAFFLYKAIFSKKKLSLKLGKIDNAAADLLQDSFDKALDDYNYIQESLKDIRDKDLVRQLQKMQHIARNFLYYLQEHPYKISAARKFIDYYQDRAVVLVDKYQELEKTGLNTAEVQEIKARMKQSLDSFDEAYEEQFTIVLNHQVMDIDAELQVMEQNFAEDGIANGSSSADWNIDSGRSDAERTPLYSRSSRGIPDGEKGRVIKTKIIAALLGIFFGSFGAHKFYMGKTGWGVLYLLFCWTIIPGVVGFVEGVRYLFMSLDDFYFQYYNG